MRCKECGSKIAYESMSDNDTWNCQECGTDTGVEA